MTQSTTNRIPLPQKSKVIGVAGLLYSATLWGLMWWPFRELAAQGMPVALAQLVNYGVAVLLGVPLLFGVLRRPWQWQWEIILIGLAGGLANIGFLTAVIHGSVMRITLLFYLSPLWTLLLSWWLLHERPNRYGLGVFALACTGGALMLWRPELGVPVPQTAYEWLGLMAGFCFASANVLSRRAQRSDPAVMATGIWVGCIVVAIIALYVFGTPLTPLLHATANTWMWLIGLGAALVLGILGVQIGLQRISATQAVVIMLFELVVAAVSAYFLAGETLGLRELLGAGLIIAASVFSGKLAAA